AQPFEAMQRVQRLTERERAIADQLASGLLNREIAERLGISARTVEVHRQSLMRKLEVKTVAELITLLTRAEGGRK
ncbi:MAG: response regulator transcription factor, partial [Sutterella sp.]